MGYDITHSHMVLPPLTGSATMEIVTCIGTVPTALERSTGIHAMSLQSISHAFQHTLAATKRRCHFSVADISATSAYLCCGAFGECKMLGRLLGDYIGRLHVMSVGLLISAASYRPESVLELAENCPCQLRAVVLPAREVCWGTASRQDLLGDRAV